MPTSTIINGTLQQELVRFGSIIGLSATDPRLIAAQLIRVALGFVGIIFLILILWSGAQFLFSGGKEEQVGKAKRTFINAIIGLILILSAYSIVKFVLGAVLP